MRVLRTGFSEKLVDEEPVVFSEYELYKERKFRMSELVKQGTVTNEQLKKGEISAKLRRYIDGNKVIPFEKFVGLLDEYFKELENGELEVISHGRVIKLKGRRACCLEGLCRFLGISVDMWHKYESGEGFERYHEICRFARTLIDERIITGGLEGLYNSTFAKFYLENRSTVSYTHLRAPRDS